MTSRDKQDPWSRIVAAAHAHIRDDEYIATPFGFATRVVAIAFSRPPQHDNLIELYAARAVVLAWGVAACSIFVGYDWICEFICSPE